MQKYEIHFTNILSKCVRILAYTDKRIIIFKGLLLIRITFQHSERFDRQILYYSGVGASAATKFLSFRLVQNSLGILVSCHSKICISSASLRGPGITEVIKGCA